MTEEDKKLLFFDLSTRVLYNPKIRLSLDIHQVDDLGEEIVEHHEENSTLIGTIHLCDGFIVLNESHNWFNIEEVKPYLRLMSSMTEEELNELRNYSELLYDNLELSSFQNGTYKCLDFYLSEVPADVVIKVFDWLHMYHFDYRGLISMGLALEAPKGMYDNNK